MIARSRGPSTGRRRSSSGRRCRRTPARSGGWSSSPPWSRARSCSAPAAGPGRGGGGWRGRGGGGMGSVLGVGRGPAHAAALSRLVLHHVPDPIAFLRAQRARVHPGGVVVVMDHTGDPDPEAARWHQGIESARDRTHTRSLTPGEIVAGMARVGLADISLVEEPFELDFDEWFDRRTSALPNAQVRSRLLAGRARGFVPVPRPDGGVTIRNLRALARGTVPW